MLANGRGNSTGAPPGQLAGPALLGLISCLSSSSTGTSASRFIFWL